MKNDLAFGLSRAVAHRVTLCPVNVLIFRVYFVWFHNLTFFFLLQPPAATDAQLHLYPETPPEC